MLCQTSTYSFYHHGSCVHPMTMYKPTYEDLSLCIAEMLEMQDEINKVVNPDWRVACYPWYRAIWTEAAELMDHIGWKWWKKQEPDLAQIHLELVDIWHFGMSDLIRGVEHSAVGELAEQLAGITRTVGVDMTGVLERCELLALLEEFTISTITSRRFDVVKFFRLMKATGLTLSDLYTTYLGKNVLNKFRQDNGYKDGTYIKLWNGVEDNVRLAEIIPDLQALGTLSAETVYNALAESYATVKTQALSN